MDKKILKQQLLQEGFKFVYEWKDEPNVSYSEHSHKDRVAFYIIAGNLTFNFGGKEMPLEKGMRFDVPVGSAHTAVIGEEGCEFVVGEMIEGDS